MKNRMKKYLYILTAIILAACSSDKELVEVPGNDNGITEGKQPIEEPAIREGVWATIPELELYGEDEPTRTSLVFDYNTRTMPASWQENDHIGVFSITSNGTQGDFVLANGQKQVGQNLDSGSFNPEDDKITVTDGHLYASYSPYRSYTGINVIFPGAGEFTYDRVPVTYMGQMQNVNVNIDGYYNRTDASNDYQYLKDYLASEPLASAHLGAYDYLVSTATAMGDGNVDFKYSRVGAVVRLFFQVPAGEVFDSLQIVNNQADFILKGEINLQTRVLTPTVTGHVMSLKLGEQGFNFTTVAGNTSYNHTNSKGYIIAYFMCAPITLTDKEPCKFYLCGHTTDGNGNFVKRKYYTNTVDLTKMDMISNKIQQWAPKTDEDEPIKLMEIEVEQWQEATGFESTGGTGSW